MGGYRLHLYCTGRAAPNEPTVVLSAARGDDVNVWRMVQPGLAGSSRVCSYDRAGSGWSDLGRGPATVHSEAAELRELLRRGGERGPYMLVGHAFGTLVARRFQADHPDEVRGMVLVSPPADATERDSVALNERGPFPLGTLPFRILIPDRRSPTSVHAPLSADEYVRAMDDLARLSRRGYRTEIGGAGEYVQLEDPEIVVLATRGAITDAANPLVPLPARQRRIAGGACPDLSGKYIIPGEDGSVFVTISQTRCDSINIEWLIYSYPDSSRTNHVLPLDGKFHRDTVWYGGSGTQLTSAQFKADALELAERATVARDTPVVRKRWFMLLPNMDADLCIRWVERETVVKQLAGRQVYAGSAGVAEAARRVGERECPTQ
jgi:pimeloyl-ACP methyl ester carboxylesterase